MSLWSPEKLEKVLDQEEENTSSTLGLVSITSGLNVVTHKIVIIINAPQGEKYFQKSIKTK